MTVWSDSHFSQQSVGLTSNCWWNWETVTSLVSRLSVTRFCFFSFSACCVFSQLWLISVSWDYTLLWIKWFHQITFFHTPFFRFPPLFTTCPPENCYPDYFKPILQMFLSFRICGINAIWHMVDIRLNHHHHSPQTNRYYHTPAIPSQCQSPITTAKLHRSPQEESQVIRIILKLSGFKYFHKDVPLFICVVADLSSCSPTCCSNHSSAAFRHWSLHVTRASPSPYLVIPPPALPACLPSKLVL